MKGFVAVTSLLVLAVSIALHHLRGPNPTNLSRLGALETAAGTGSPEGPAPPPLQTRRLGVGADLDPPPSQSPAPILDGPRPQRDLLGRLEEIARGFASPGDPSFREEIESLLRDPSTVFDVLSLFKSGGLKERPDALRGAGLVLALALVSYDPPLATEELRELTVKVDGRQFARSLLQALPDFEDPERREFLALLRSLSVEGRPPLKGEYFRDIVALLSDRPDAAGTYVELLGLVAKGIEENELYDDLHLVLLGRKNDPAAVGLGLSGLLKKYPSFVGVAERLFHESADSAMRNAIAGAIGSTAPVGEAARSLARLAPTSAAAALSLLGERPEGLKAAVDVYQELASAGENPAGRKTLVVAMHADPDAVFDIARTDPDATVRAQALVTATGHGPPRAEYLRELSAAFGEWDGDRGGWYADHLLWASYNLVVRSSGELRQGAVGLALGMLADERIPAGTRWNVLLSLDQAGGLSDANLGNLTIGGTSALQWLQSRNR